MGKGSGGCNRESMMLETPTNLLEDSAVTQATLFDNSGLLEFISKIYLDILEMNSKRMPAGVAGGSRNKFSPSELEAYFRCQYGWFLSYVVKIPQPAYARRSTGFKMHKFLEQAGKNGLDKSLADNVNKDPELLNRKESLIKIYNKYILEVESDKKFEESLNLTLPTGHIISGKADRVDIIDNTGVVVIDYKLSAALSTTPEKRLSQIQRFLYPLMAAQKYNLQPYGMIYVNLEKNQHEGSISSKASVDSFNLFNSGNIDDNWDEESQICLNKIQTAIESIENGAWFNKGQKCPPWCPCNKSESTIYEDVRIKLFDHAQKEAKL